MNFQINMVTIFVLLLSTLIVLRGGWWYFTLFIPNLYAFGMAIWGATRASRGIAVRYPFVVRIVRAIETPAGPVSLSGGTR